MSEKLRVVIVDDTPDLRLLVRMSLELDPHIAVVGEAEDGRGAIDLARHEQPDVMLLDLAMPVMDGMQALPEVVRLSPGTAVLVLSGFAASTMAEEAVAAGATGYLQKGIGAEDLCEEVWRASGRQRPEAGLDDVFSLLPTEPAIGTAAGTTTAPQRDLAARAADVAPAGLAVLGAPPGTSPDGWLFLYLNAEAQSLLDIAEDRVGERVGDLVPALATALDGMGADGAAGVARLDTARGPVTVRARWSDDEVVLSLAPAAGSAGPADDEEVGRLRTALARTAHELRSPVSVIVGLAEAAQLGGVQLSAGQREEIRQALLRQSEILERLTSDLETTSHVHRDALAIELGRVDVAEVVRDALTAAGLDPQVALHADRDVVATADPPRLTQILTNLLSNARKYGEPPIEVHVVRRGDEVHLTVADHGPGVPEEFRPLLFEEFTRAHQDARGTGLGLSVVRSLARAQGGSVEHQPRPGGGSLFTVRLRAEGPA